MDLLHLFNSKDGSIYTKEDLAKKSDFELRKAVDKELDLLKKKREQIKKQQNKSK